MYSPYAQNTPWMQPPGVNPQQAIYPTQFPQEQFIYPTDPYLLNRAYPQQNLLNTEQPNTIFDTAVPSANAYDDPFVTNPYLSERMMQDLNSRIQVYEPGWDKEQNAKQINRPIDIEKFDTDGTLDLTPEVKEKQPFDWNQLTNVPFNPWSTNMTTDYYNLGRFIGMDKGTPGRGLGIASAGISAGLGSARTLMSGLATQKASSRALTEARDKMQQQSYRPAMLYGNTNYLGGFSN